VLPTGDDPLIRTETMAETSTRGLVNEHPIKTEAFATLEISLASIKNTEFRRRKSLVTGLNEMEISER